MGILAQIWAMINPAAALGVVVSLLCSVSSGFGSERSLVQEIQCTVTGHCLEVSKVILERLEPLLILSASTCSPTVSLGKQWRQKAVGAVLGLTVSLQPSGIGSAHPQPLQGHEGCCSGARTCCCDGRQETQAHISKEPAFQEQPASITDAHRVSQQETAIPLL